MKTENDLVLQNMIENLFLEGWKKGSSDAYENFRSLELIVSSACNLKCKYCYYTNYGDQLYPKELFNSDKVLENAIKWSNFLKANNYTPKLEIFSGEPFVIPAAIEIIDLFIDTLKGSNQPIIVPTNCTWANDDNKMAKIQELQDKALKNNVNLCLSASIDGKYCESNRPFKSGKETRDDAYYDRLFEFAKKNKFGFHPMLYSEKIEAWKDNFLWFQEMFKKHSIRFDNIYLLEVRNYDWTETQMYELYKFMRFLVHWTHKYLGNQVDRTVDFILKSGFNILRSPISSVGRGIGCAIQSSLHVRLGDNALVPCHRLSYPHLLFGYADIKNNKLDITAKNLEFASAILTSDFKNQPYCESCLLKYSCSLGCLGSQYEVTGDPFVPIPTACKMEHFKVAGLVRGFTDIGADKIFMSLLKPEKRLVFERIGGIYG